ncbi:MAG: protein kinase [Polyangiaceae bacterium]|nr:protein kinase [Polyangiaceae bacterium]
MIAARSNPPGTEPTPARISRCVVCGQRSLAARCPAHGPIAADDEDPAPPEEPLQAPPGYRVTGVVGQGGFGVVLAAEPEGGGRRIAIKVPRGDRPGAEARLLYELRALSCIGPPHVPAVFGSGRLDGGALYFAMELIDSPTLAERLARRGGPMDPAEACAAGVAVLRALDAVHSRGYVHRDLKPENIFLDDACARAIIADFGLATRAGSGEHALALTQPGAVLGTAEYMAPEQCQGQAIVDGRTDLYAVGVILYEMLMGHPPFWGAAPVAKEGHVSRRPPPLRSGASAAVTPQLEDIVLRCLAKDPRDRYPSAAALRAALAAALPSTRAAAAPAGPAVAAPPLPARAAAHERRTMCLVLFESSEDGMLLRKRVGSSGGQVLHAAGGRYVVAFGHEVDENPVRSGARAASDLVRRGLCERALVDLAQVTVQIRHDGSKRLYSSLAGRGDRFPGRDGTSGVTLSPAARAVLREDDALDPGSLIPTSDTTSSPSITGPLSARARESPLLVGRGAVLDSLLLAARRAADERIPTVATVVAEAGYGKSHLARALAGRLRELVPHAIVVDLRAREPVAGGALQSVRDLLQQALDLPARAPPGAAQGLLEARLGMDFTSGAPGRAPRGAPSAPSPVRSVEAAAVAFALGWAQAGGEPAAPAGEGPVVDYPELRTLRAAPGALRSVLTTAAGEALRRRAAGAPLFVVLDDAHFADDATLSILEHAARAGAGAPLFVCALARASFEEARPAFGARARHHEVHRLGPLDEASASELCRALLLPAENVPESAVRRLVARTQGVPLLLVELIRGLKEEGVIRRLPGSTLGAPGHAPGGAPSAPNRGGAYYLATDELDKVPDLPLIEWLAHRAVDALAPALQAHARLVAARGAEVTAQEVQGVLRSLERAGAAGELPLDARIGIDRLIAAGLLEARGQGRVAFRHALLREAIVRSMPDAFRRAIHLASVEYYRGAAALHEERRLPQLAHHAEQAGLGAFAADAYLALAAAARERHAYLDAELFYTRAIELSPRSEGDLPDAYRGRGLMRHRLGRYHDALVDLARAREAARAAGDALFEAEILLDEAMALDWMDDHASSRERVERARELLSARSTPLLEARLLLGIGRSLHRRGLEEQAAEHLERARDASARLGAEAYETHVIALLMISFIYQTLARLDDAERALDATVALSEAHADALHLCSATNSRALLWALRGDAARAIADFEREIALGRELGQDALELMGHYNLAEYLYQRGEVEAAAPHVERALSIEARRTGGAVRPIVPLLDARIALYRGDEAAARAIAASIRDRAAPGEPLPVPSEEVLCEMIELSTRDSTGPEWDALEDRSERSSIGQERLEVLEARALWALRRGRPAEAARRLEAAIECASRIPNAMGPRLARGLAKVREYAPAGA